MVLGAWAQLGACQAQLGWGLCELPCSSVLCQLLQCTASSTETCSSMRNHFSGHTGPAWLYLRLSVDLSGEVLQALFMCFQVQCASRPELVHV